MPQYVAGFDNGGTVVKSAIFDLSGNEIISRSVKTPVLTPQPGWTERNSDELFWGNCSCMNAAIADSGINPCDIAGVSLCGHGKGLYTWGKNGSAAYNGIVSTDGRAWEYPIKWY